MSVAALLGVLCVGALLGVHGPRPVESERHLVRADDRLRIEHAKMRDAAEHRA